MQAENLVLEYARERGLPAVAMCVSTTYGAGDWGRTPHGAIIAGAAFGKLPFVMSGIELEAVGIDDAARAMLLAAEKGRVGERYLISEKMIANADVVRIAAEAAGVPAPTKKIPLALSYAMAALGSVKARLKGTDERLSLDSLRLMRAEAPVDCSKAKRELGWQPRPVEDSIREAAKFWVGLRDAKRAAKPRRVSDKLRVDLHGAPATMLATLYAKALDADAPDSILHDNYARDIVDRIDYDWASTTITARNAPSVTMRSAHFDEWTRQFLAEHPEAVVLHLGCGLDSRFFRVQPGPGVDWYDIDYPDVARLRERFYPETSGHHVIAASVTDPAWLAEIPADRPTLMVAEGLTMYLTEAEGTALMRRIVDRFPCGELQFDAFNRLGIKTQWMQRAWFGDREPRCTGRSTVPTTSPQRCPEPVLLQWVPVFESDAFDRLGGGYRVMAAVMNSIPGLRTMAQFHRYAY